MPMNVLNTADDGAGKLELPQVGAAPAPGASAMAESILDLQLEGTMSQPSCGWACLLHTGLMRSET